VQHAKQNEPMAPTSSLRLAILPRLLILLLALLSGEARLTAAQAQHDTASGADSSAILGELVDRHTREPIANAKVAVASLTLVTVTDSLGHFAVVGLPAGPYIIDIRAVGYAPATWRFTLAPRQQLKHTFEMDLLPVQLPEVVVKGKTPLSERRFADFERRRETGMGAFITQEQIERANPTSLVDMLVRVRGVLQVCLTNDCVAKMARSPPGCYPQYYLDGRESTPYFARLTPPHDVKGIEIYRGSSETPGEFQGSNSGCGVIAIWTKSSP
jgi:Carboxypeptidase regulatory-like domain